MFALLALMGQRVRREEDEEEEEDDDDESQAAEEETEEEIHFTPLVPSVDDTFVVTVREQSVLVTKNRTRVGGVRLPRGEVVVSVVRGSGDAWFVCSRCDRGMYATWRAFKALPVVGYTSLSVSGGAVRHMVPREIWADELFARSACDQFVTAPQGLLMRTVRDARGVRLTQNVNLTTGVVESEARFAEGVRVAAAGRVGLVQTAERKLVSVGIEPAADRVIGRGTITGPIVQSPSGESLAFITDQTRVWWVGNGIPKSVELPPDVMSRVVYVDRFFGDGEGSVVVRDVGGEDAWVCTFFH